MPMRDRMLKVKLSKLLENMRKRRRIILLCLPCVLMLTLYFVAGKQLEFETLLSIKTYVGGGAASELADGYLVWNPRCHIMSLDPLDWSIKKYILKYKFEACSLKAPISYVTKDPKNGSIALVVNMESIKSPKSTICCWSPIFRPAPAQPPTANTDSKITVGECVNFVNRVILSPEIDTAMITCRQGKTTIYKNIHAIINPARVRERLTIASEPKQHGDNMTTMSSTNEMDDDDDDDDDERRRRRRMRKLSILVLGIDSVSRLNFKRSLPKTDKYFHDNDWFHLEGYNKIGDNTFPNLMAILTGMNATDAYAKCKPTVPYGLDNCPILWHEYRNSGYVTAYGEEWVSLSTFNYHKVGFVEPPTDYYLRPYTIATEKLLVGKKHFGNEHYCTGPETSFERIFNYAIEFARTFTGLPYFGFFWTNSMSHENVNGISSMDERLRDMFEKLDKYGIANDTMIVFLSDHGMRWGDIRRTSVGWYEERLPFIYVKIPHWFRNREPNAYQALRINENRLTSPYDLYETLRDILNRAGGSANASTGCPTCQTLFEPVAQRRGCSEAGISPHWCTCTVFRNASDTSDKILLDATTGLLLKHIENIIKHYRDKNGKRLCSKLKLKKIHRFDEIIDVRETADKYTTVVGYFFLIEVTPGNGHYEATIRYDDAHNLTINENEISRINSYASTSSCLEHGSKQYCHCLGQ